MAATKRPVAGGMICCSLRNPRAAMRDHCRFLEGAGIEHRVHAPRAVSSLALMLLRRSSPPQVGEPLRFPEPLDRIHQQNRRTGWTTCRAFDLDHMRGRRRERADAGRRPVCHFAVIQRLKRESSRRETAPGKSAPRVLEADGARFPKPSTPSSDRSRPTQRRDRSGRTCRSPWRGE